MSDVPFPLLRTKLRRPLPASSWVPRQRLVDKLSERPDATLTLIVASAGSGKTTAVVEWLEHIRWPVAWLSLDETDNDLAVFLSYLIAAIDTTLPGACADSARLLHAPQPPPVDYLIAALVNELSGVTQPFVLVLDDYHHIRDASIHQLVGQLLHHAPPALHLVDHVSLRSSPAGEPSCGPREAGRDPVERSAFSSPGGASVAGTDVRPPPGC